MDKDKLLKQAKDHCFFISLNDSGAELAKANTVYGIAGIHYLQEKLGFPSRATFISTPDMTITRNTSRWGSGFGYGGKISWGEGDDELVILNTKPNACGMLVGGLEELPSIERLIKKLHQMEKEKIEIDGVKAEWDFYKSNHFIDLFEVKPVAKTRLKLPPFAFIIHGSCDELRNDNELTGFGLYYDKSNKLAQKAEKIKTPFGDFFVLTGKSARDYFKMYKKAEKFSKKKRRLAARLLFDDFVEISNQTHQGLINMNEIILGCHYLRNTDKTLFPLTLRGDLPAYLVRGIPNLSSENIELLGFEKRAKRLGVYEKLLVANIFPHGGGYILPDILNVNKVIEIEGKRYFEVEMQNDRGKKIISEVRELAYDYRGRTVILRALEVDIIKVIAKLIPRYVFKI